LTPACPRQFEVEAMRDGRLTGPERASFGRHLTTCRACAHEADALDELARRLGADGAGGLPADELRVARERTRLLADFDRRLLSTGGGTRRWLLWSATAMAIACGLFVAPRSRPRSQTTEGPGAVVSPEVGTIWSKQVDGDAEKIVLVRGALAVHVDHAPSRRGRLVVVLPDGELEDIGTTFSVRAADGRTQQVSVQEGSVLLRVLGSAPIALSAGQTWTPAEARVSNAGATTALEPIGPPASVPKAKREPRQLEAAAPRRAHPQRDPNERDPNERDPNERDPNERDRSNEFRAAVHLLERGDDCEAAAGFAGYVASHPDDRRAEDAAYLRVIALQRCGSDDDMKRAAREYLRRYPGAFRRAEVDRLSR
jgi:hypothetical protein